MAADYEDLWIAPHLYARVADLLNDHGLPWVWAASDERGYRLRVPAGNVQRLRTQIDGWSTASPPPASGRA